MVIARIVLYLLGSVMLAGCQGFSTAPTLTLVTPTPPPTEATAEPTLSEWIQHEVDGVLLGVEKPKGWHAQETEDGILLVEYSASIANSDKMPGVQVHVFVHSIDKFDLSLGGNIARSVLDQIIQNKDYIGNARVDKPFGFEWGSHEAAYYLSNNGDGNVTMLIAVAIPDSQQMVACNITSPIREAGRIRSILPAVLNTLTVNDVLMDVSDLNNLPDPLVFPPEPPYKRP